MNPRIMIGASLMLVSSLSFAADPAPTATLDKPAPNFVATGIDGKEFKLSEKTATGKNIVLMFSRAHW